MTLLYGEARPRKLLILSQVVLSFQLPFAVIPLVWLTADRRKLGALSSPRWLTVLGRRDRGGHRRAEPQAPVRRFFG